MSLKMDRIVGRGENIWGDDDSENNPELINENQKESHNDELSMSQGENVEDDTFDEIPAFPDIDHRYLNDEAQRRMSEITEIAERERVRALEQTKESARKLIQRVMKSPFEKNRKIIMLKAFMKWHKMLPMHQKCDELAKILQDRLVAVASMRDSYLRDIVRVKYHLSKIQEYRDPGKENAAVGKYTEETGHDMYDLHTVPSISLRMLIDRGLEALRTEPGEDVDASQQLQDTLMQSGLANPMTGKSFNPWERSKQFRRIQAHRKGQPGYVPPSLSPL
jgi:hypothetical protein